MKVFVSFLVGLSMMGEAVLFLTMPPEFQLLSFQLRGYFFALGFCLFLAGLGMGIAIVMEAKR